MDRVNKFGLMGQSTLVDGVKIKFKAMVNLYMQIKMSMKENFMLIELMVMESMSKNVVKRMKDIGLTTSPTDRANSYLRTDQSTKVNSKMV